jgi:hypothetical protein
MKQNLIKIFIINLLVIFIGQNYQSQNKKDLRLKIEGANQLFIEKKYEIAKDLWLEIAQEQKNNSNINYKTGVTLLKASNTKLKSLKYLKIAIKRVSKSYSPFDNSIVTAPIDVFYYIAKAFHYNNKQDSAIKYLNQFISVASKKHYLKKDAEKLIQQCKNFSTVNRNENSHKIINDLSLLNSDFDEMNPLVSLDGNTIIFSSNKARGVNVASNKNIFDIATGKHFLDLYISYKNVRNNEWSSSKLMPGSKTKTNEIGIGQSEDLEKIFFSDLNNDSKNISPVKFSRKQQDFYSIKEFKEFTDYNISSIHISKNNSYMLFSSNKSGGYGGEDLWFSEKKEDNSWSKPVNMGPNINSSYDEISPFLHADGVTLFYSSNNKKSIGGYDIFVSQKDKNNLWSDAENLGIPINTVFNEKYFSTSIDGTIGYYESNNEKENTDISSVNIEKPYSKPQIYLSGFIDKQNQELLESNYLIKLINTDLESKPIIYEPNKYNGSYIFKAEECYHYDIQYFKLVTLKSGSVKESLIHEQTLKTPCESDLKILKLIKLPTIDIHGKVILNESYSSTKEEIVEEFKRRHKKYNFKEIIGSENNLIALLLLDEDGKIIDKAILTPEGFKFELLNSSSNYNFKLENFPDSLDLSDIPIFLLEDGKETFIHGDFEKNNSFTYINNFNTYKFKELLRNYVDKINLFLIDENDQIVQKGKLTDNGFKFELISSQLKYSFRIENFPENLDLSEIPIEIINHDEQLLVVGDFSNENKFILPKIHFKKSFQIGQYSIENNPDFIRFMEETINKINENGKVKVEIVGSASRIPSKKFKSNTELAKIRVKKGKKAIFDYLKTQNISQNKVQIVKEKAIVSGPKFDDNNKEKSKYYDYQYFSIWVE